MDNQNKKIRHGEWQARGKRDTGTRGHGEFTASPFRRVSASKFFDRGLK